MPHPRLKCLNEDQHASLKTNMTHRILTCLIVGPLETNMAVSNGSQIRPVCLRWVSHQGSWSQMGHQWVSNGSPMGLQWVSNGSPMGLRLVSDNNNIFVNSNKTATKLNMNFYVDHIDGSSMVFADTVIHLISPPPLFLLSLAQTKQSF